MATLKLILEYDLKYHPNEQIKDAYEEPLKIDDGFRIAKEFLDVDEWQSRLHYILEDALGEDFKVIGVRLE